MPTFSDSQLGGVREQILNQNISAAIAAAKSQVGTVDRALSLIDQQIAQYQQTINSTASVVRQVWPTVPLTAAGISNGVTSGVIDTNTRCNNSRAAYLCTFVSSAWGVLALQASSEAFRKCWGPKPITSNSIASDSGNDEKQGNKAAIEAIRIAAIANSTMDEELRRQAEFASQKQLENLADLKKKAAAECLNDPYIGKTCSYFTRPLVEIIAGVERRNIHEDGSYVCHKDGFYECVTGVWQCRGSCSERGDPSFIYPYRSAIIEKALAEPAPVRITEETNPFQGGEFVKLRAKTASQKASSALIEDPYDFSSQGSASSIGFFARMKENIGRSIEQFRQDIDQLKAIASNPIEAFGVSEGCRWLKKDNPDRPLPSDCSLLRIMPR
jgi:hypothetical protein